VTGEWEDRVLGFSTVRGQPNLLIAWVTGSAARQFETRSEDEVLMKCSTMLRTAVGTDFAYEEPTRVIRSLWQSNPHFCGSYSFRSKKSVELDVCPSDLAEPVINSNGSVRLFFAGEATHDHRYSTVHAAVETGWREADRIVEHVKETNFTAKL
jgi:monoamine oxidase